MIDMPSKIKYIYNIGDIIGDFTLLEYIGYDNSNCKTYKIKCNICRRERNVRINDLRRGHGNSHKNCIRYVEQGIYFKRFRIRWLRMRDRTTNPNCDHYDCYGGRGISSETYKYFIDFYDDMFESYKAHAIIYEESNTSLERVDVNGNYEKENITWIELKEQKGNTRKNKLFEATSPEGVKSVHKNQTKFAKENNLDLSCVNGCLKGKYKQLKGWTFKLVEDKE